MGLVTVIQQMDIKETYSRFEDLGVAETYVKTAIRC